MNRRLLATRVASTLRLTPLLERFASRPGLAVLVYHRIASPVGFAYDTAVIEATPDEFDDQMRMLRKHHDVAGPEELFHLVEHPHEVKSFRVGITFDDGYLDNYEVAFPILKSHGLSATFFLPTHYVGSRHLPWWDQVAFLVRRADRAELILDYPKHLVVKVDREDVDSAIVSVLRAYTRAESVELGPYLAAVEKACGASLPSEAEQRQFLTWDEAATMQRAGMAIGSHTHSHNILATLSAEEQAKECRDSRALLRDRSLAAESLAYPVGKPTSFSRDTMRCAKDAGYRCAFTNYGGVNLPGRIDPFDVKRIGMSFGEDTSQMRLRLALTAASRRQAW
jgi:peptidoglycan/xylan/chitin deacetylase (PgdA/CDA1 family)